MIRKKRITIISVALIILAVIAVLYGWKYSFEYRHKYEEYDGQKIIFTEDDEYTAHLGTRIIGKNKSISCKGNGVYAVNQTLYITSGGVYTIEGEFENIIVQSGDDMPVIVQLNNAVIESNNKPPVYVYKASKFILSSVENSINHIIDERKKYSEQNIKSSIYSAADLTLNGEGKTVVQSNYRDAITTENTLKIVSGDWDISAEDDGISGRIIFQKGGNLICSSVGDAVKSDKKNNKGLIVLRGGKLITNSQGDGVFSSGNIYANGTAMNIQTSELDLSDIGDSSKEKPSTKGVKADKGIYVNGSSIDTNTSDDSLHAAEMIHVYNGKFILSSKDDAIHCDKDIYFDNANLSITDCYEGMEGAHMEINGGKYHIIAEDDGINVSDGTSMPMPPPDAPTGGEGEMPPNNENNIQNIGEPPAMPGAKEEPSEILFVFNDGDLYIESGGDGIDINGSAEVNGGDIETYCIKDGPEEAFDFDGELYVNGGNIFGAGNANMFELPSEDSKANNLVCYMDQTYRNGGELIITNSTGEEIEHHNLTGSLGIAIAYGDKIKSGETYTVTMNGKELGTATIQEVNTVIKPASANNGPGGGAHGGPPPMGPDGKPLEPPPDGSRGRQQGGGAPGGPPPMGPDGKPLEPPPDGPEGGQINGDQTEQELNSLSNDDLIANMKNVLYAFAAGSILIIICILFAKSIKRRF